MLGAMSLGCAETRYCRGRPFSEADSSMLDDIFSIGSLFVEVFTGRRPYDDVDSGDVTRRFEERVFPSADEIEPESYVRIICKCWNEQYQSSIDLQNDLPPIEEDSTTIDGVQ